MLLLPTPVWQAAHGNSPKLYRRSSPVPQIMIFFFPAFTLSPFFSIRAREIDKSQSVRQFSKWSAISGRTYGNSRLEVCVRIYVTFEIWKSLFRGYRREFWCIYLSIAASLFTKYLSIFLDVLSAENIFKQNKNTSEFPRINSCCFRRQVHSSSSVRVQSAK